MLAKGNAVLGKVVTVAAPLIAAASNQKIFFDQLAAASIQEWSLIKKIVLQKLRG